MINSSSTSGVPDVLKLQTKFPRCNGAHPDSPVKQAPSPRWPGPSVPTRSAFVEPRSVTRPDPSRGFRVGPATRGPKGTYLGLGQQPLGFWGPAPGQRLKTFFLFLLFDSFLGSSQFAVLDEVQNTLPPAPTRPRELSRNPNPPSCAGSRIPLDSPIVTPCRQPVSEWAVFKARNSHIMHMTIQLGITWILV